MNEPYTSPAGQPAAPAKNVADARSNEAQPQTPPGGGYVPAVSPAGYYVPTPKCQLVSDRRDLGLAIVLGLLAVLGVNASLFGGFQLGYAITCVGMALTGGIYLRRSGRVDLYSVFCLLAALACAGVFVWHTDRFTRFWLGGGIVFLSMLALLEYTGTQRRGSGTVGCVADVCSLWCVRPLNHLGTAVSAIFRREQNGQVQKRRCGGVLIGLLCAIPVLAILVPLLIGADAAFEGLMRLTVLEHLGEWLGSLVLGLGLFCVVYARLFGLRHRLDLSPEAAPRPLRGLDAAPLCTFLGAISLVYILYLAAQFAYFTSAFSGILPADYTAAQYARRGFFEMCVLCAINLGLVGSCLGLSRKIEGKAPLATRLFCLFILLFSLGLVATSAAKMALYIQSFGLTRLRVLTNLFMAMMAVVIVAVIVRLFRPRFPYMRLCVVGVVLIGLCAAYADVDTVVARYNVTAYQQQRLKTVDIATLEDLSDGAIPYLAQLTKDSDAEIAADAVTALYQRLENTGSWEENAKGKPVLKPLTTADWRSYSVDGRRAQRLLEAFAASPAAQEMYRAEQAW